MSHALLIIDFNDRQRDLIVRALRERGFSVEAAAESEAALRAVLGHPPRLLIMAEHMPPVNDTELLPALRRLTDAPIIVVGHGGELAVVHALSLGADAYVPISEGVSMLEATVTAILRRHKTQNDWSTETRGGGGEISFHTHWLDQLSPVEQRLLRYLMAVQGAVATAEELLAHVWDSRARPGTLRFHVHQIRRKLANNSVIQIVNQYGLGYRLQFRRSRP